ncbi:CHAPERONE-LIKE PROTEIN OF POR1 [Nymphaea thermarum]|nr:CHAPERONE-LIKE PROTEIN OF POR1 [Nymphaea thermarum]
MEVTAGAAFSLGVVGPVNHGRCRWEAGGAAFSPPPSRARHPAAEATSSGRILRWAVFPSRRGRFLPPLSSGSSNSRAEDPVPPSEMSVESALKLLGVAEGASFDDILRAKNSIIASSKDDQKLKSQVEAAYDMLLMESLTQRRAGKVVNSNIRFADVRTVSRSGPNTLPGWLKSIPLSVNVPPATSVRIQAGVYGALMISAYINGVSSPGVPYAGADVPGFILATGFGASLIFLTKKNVGLGKAAVLTVGGLAAGAAVGSVVEQWLQVEIVPLLGLHSPAALISEFILLSQFLVSLYLS